MWCRGHSMYTHSRQRRGGGLEKSYAFFSLGQRRLCAVVCLLVHSKENAVERPLHELPQKVRDDVFSTLVILPLCGFDLLSLLSLFFLLTSLFHPSSPPATTLFVLSAFTQAAQWAALPCRRGGVLAVSLAVRAHVMSSQRWHPTKGGILCLHCIFHIFNSLMHCSKQWFFQLPSCYGAMVVAHPSNFSFVCSKYRNNLDIMKVKIKILLRAES